MLVLFAVFAVVATLGIVGALSLWSTVSDVVQDQQGRRLQALKTAQAQLGQYGISLFENDMDVEFYNDGCIVRGTGYSKERGAVRVEVSIAITESTVSSKIVEKWAVETVTVNGEVAYQRLDL